VGRPPQELMRGWGKPPIYRDSRPNHRLGIQATQNIAEEGKKGSMVGRGRLAKSAETRAEALESEEGLKEESEL
jgi:hypothetical protein